MPSGIELILADHQRFNALFDQFAADGDGPTVGLILDALTVHDSAEHAALYPMALAVLSDGELVHRCDLAHMQVQALMEHTRGQEGAALVAAVTELRVAVTEHVRDEEMNLLPALQKKATTAQLETLGARIEQNKQRAG